MKKGAKPLRFCASALLGFGLALPVAAQLDSTCPESQRNQWVDACASVIGEASQPPPSSQPRDPWSIIERTDIVFGPDKNLAESFFEKCSVLLGQRSWPSDRCPKTFLIQWLEGCVADARALTPGAPRSVLLETFTTEGGIYTSEQRTFVHRRCTMLKIDVTFSPTRGETRDSEHPDDEVETVTPFLGDSVAD